MSQEEVKTFRYIFYFTEEKYKSTLPSNMFVHAKSKEDAEKGSASVFKEALVHYGIPNAKFRQEVFASSEEEAAEYKKNKFKKNLNNSVN